MTIGKLRSVLYKTAKYLGDVNAVKRKTVKKRIGMRVGGYFFGRILGAIRKML